MLSGPHCVPAGRPLQVKVNGSLRPFVAAEVRVVTASPLGPLTRVEGLMLREKSPMPILKLVAPVTKPSVPLTVTFSVPKGVDVEVVIVNPTLPLPPGTIGMVGASKVHDAPAGNPAHCRDENVPEYPPSLVRPKNIWNLSPGSTETFVLVGVKGYDSWAATPTVRFGFGFVP